MFINSFFFNILFSCELLEFVVTMYGETIFFD